MAVDPQISDFNADEVRAGLRLAMTVGLPVGTSDQPTFYFPTTVTSDGAHSLDQGGTPFSPTYRPTRSAPVKKQVPCGVQFHDVEGNLEAWGATSPARVTLTLLDLDYQSIKGFAYVVIGGVRYNYARTETPKGLVSVGIYKVHVLSEDQG